MPFLNFIWKAWKIWIYEFLVFQDFLKLFKSNFFRTQIFCVVIVPRFSFMCRHNLYCFSSIFLTDMNYDISMSHSLNIFGISESYAFHILRIRLKYQIFLGNSLQIYFVNFFLNHSINFSNIKRTVKKWATDAESSNIDDSIKKLFISKFTVIRTSITLKTCSFYISKRPI